MNAVLSHVVDPALRTVLEAGIGYFFKVSECEIVYRIMCLMMKNLFMNDSSEIHRDWNRYF